MGRRHYVRELYKLAGAAIRAEKNGGNLVIGWTAQCDGSVYVDPRGLIGESAHTSYAENKPGAGGSG